MLIPKQVLINLNTQKFSVFNHRYRLLSYFQGWLWVFRHADLFESISAAN